MTQIANQQSQLISSSPNSLDEVLNHVEQWSDVIVDNDALIPSSPNNSHFIPSDKEYINSSDIRNSSLHDQLSQGSDDSEEEISAIYNQIHRVDDLKLLENEVLSDEDGFMEVYEQSDDQIEAESAVDSPIMPQQEENEKSILTYLSNDMDQVIETIHVGDELFQAKKTCITGIQPPNEEFSIPIVHKTEESFEILSNKIVDYIDISSSSKIYSDDQKPEAIIVTTEEISSIYSPDYFPLSNVKIEPVQTMNEQSSIISLTIINEKLPGESLESLSVPIQTDLLPLATMPDQTNNTDEQRIPDRTVQDVLSASLEPTKMNHIDGIVEMMPIISFISTEKIKDHDEFFDAESEYIVPSEKLPIITLAEAEKLQHDAAIEQKDDDFVEPELNLITVEYSLKKNNIENGLEEKSDKPINKKKTLVSRNSVEKNEEDKSFNQKKIDENQSSKNSLVLRESPQIETIKILSSDTPIVQIEQEFLRPKFSFRLKPTITINNGDNLKLEVHFIGQPEPNVHKYFLYYYF